MPSKQQAYKFNLQGTTILSALESFGEAKSTMVDAQDGQIVEDRRIRRRSMQRIH